MSDEVSVLFRDVLLYCDEMGLIGRELFAIDGCKISSNASKERSKIRIGQVQFAYQFDFNPSVLEIGAQGTYFVIGYSESEDLAGATRLLGDVLAPTPTRIGFVPERRLNVGVGEWVVDGLRVAVEYSHIWDYPIVEGGTGKSADGVFMQLTYEW